MSGGYILVVDDEPAICDLICTSLEMAGFKSRRSANGMLAHQMIVNDRPDLVLLDWMMPMLSGIELTQRLKRDPRTQDLPVILLTARSDEDDRVRGLDAGADDYIVKPFSPREMIARIRSAAQLVLIPTEQKCQVNKQDVPLGPLEFRLLEYFMRHPNRVHSRAQLLDRVWGGNVYIDDRTVDVHIRRLRKAMSIDGHEHLIQTVRGAGYRFAPTADLNEG